jgi:hypothetical protein
MIQYLNLATVLPLLYIGFILLRLKPARRRIDNDFSLPKLNTMPTPIFLLLISRMIPGILFSIEGFLFTLIFPANLNVLRPEVLPGMALGLIAGPLGLMEFFLLTSRYWMVWHGAAKRPRRRSMMLEGSPNEDDFGDN